MNIRIKMGRDGEIQETQTAIPLKGAGGALGRYAVTKLTNLINALNEKKTERDIVTHYHIICGFAICCESCGFLTEESTDVVMHLVEQLVNKELERAERTERAEREGGRQG